MHERTVTSIKDLCQITSEFLVGLSKVGAYKYRKTLRVSDVELADKIKEDNGKFIIMMRDLVLMNDFIEANGLNGKYEIFAAEVIEEMKKGNIEDGKPK
jgi:hypothetical protein